VLLYVGLDIDLDNSQNFDNKTVILADDGAAIGATIIVAARSIKRKI
jgi:predicted phosphoribosyltransferase